MTDDTFNKAMPSPNENQMRGRGTLKCKIACVVPDVGAFEVGQTVDNHDQYVKLKDHPYFETTEGEE